MSESLESDEIARDTTTRNVICRMVSYRDAKGNIIDRLILAKGGHRRRLQIPVSSQVATNARNVFVGWKRE